MTELEVMDAELEQLAQQQRGALRPGLLPATFSVEAVYDEAKSSEKGRPVYVDREVVEINVGRDIVRRPVTEEDRRTYAAQYVAFRRGEDQEATEGMPLGQWAVMPGKALVKEFAHFGIRTVEQLAAATDATLQRIGPHMGLREKARDWLADAQKQAPLVKLREENESLKARLAALEQIVAAQKAAPVTPAAPAEDPRLAALEAQITALAEAVKNGTGKRARG